MNHFAIVALVAVLVAAVTACAPSPNTPTAPSATTTPAVNPTTVTPAGTVAPSNPPAVAVVQSSKSRAVVAATNPDIKQAADGNNSFALALYQKLRDNPGNLFYSPYSISLALAMAYAGAQGNTASQMAQTLQYTLPPDRLHPALNGLDHALATRGEGAQGQDGKGFRLNVANAIWGQEGYRFLPTFLDVLAVNYGAGLRLLDFRAPDPARIAINKWVSDRTEKKIPELLAPGTLTPETKLVLTNAIYFNAAWAGQFKPEQTHDGPFHLLGGKDVTVPMMHQTDSFGYVRSGQVEAVELPYDGHQLSMVLLVPAAGQFQQVEQTLSAESVNSLLAGLKFGRVNLTLPRWKFDTTLMLARTLGEMGMPDAITPGKADFSGMDGTHDFVIGEVVHKAFVAVDENGTEAAAATAVIMPTGALPSQPVMLTVDRPFIFIIRDIQTGTILFIGRVVNPSS